MGLARDVSSQTKGVTGRGGYDVNRRAFRHGRRLELTFEPGPQLEQDGFDVFACAQTIGKEVNAITSELPSSHIADLHRVGHAGGAADSKTREHRLARISVADGKAFIARPQTPAVNLVGIGRAPIVGGRDRNFSERPGVLSPRHVDAARLQACRQDYPPIFRGAASPLAAFQISR